MATKKRLIDANPFMKAGWHLVKTGKSNEYLASMSLADVPTVDAVEVVHGRWEVVRGVITPGGDPLLRCPRCRSRESEHLGGIECNRTHWNYCPICGMTMDGGNDNG